MKTGALLLFLSAPFAFAQGVTIPPQAPQQIPEVHTLSKIVTLAGLGTRTYWAAGTESRSLQTILKVRQSDGSDKIYYLPDPYRPADLFRRDLETEVIVTGAVMEKNGKSFLNPYSAAAR